jgi:hypothetical protein
VAAEARLEGLIGTDVQSLCLPRAWSRPAYEVLRVIAWVIFARQNQPREHLLIRVGLSHVPNRTLGVAALPIACQLKRATEICGKGEFCAECVGGRR